MPTCAFTIPEAGPLPPSNPLPGAVEVELDDWRAGRIDLWRFDRDADALGQHGALRVRLRWSDPARPSAEELSQARWQLRTRCQRWARRRGEALGSAFDDVLARHRALHDLDRPLVAADYAHALDSWQWTLSLDPAASAALQLAALLHDIERLASEAEVRTEHQAGDYLQFKAAHARGSARMAQQLLERAGVDAPVRARACALIEQHDRPGSGAATSDPELALLEDADALSFFSLNLGGFLSYYGLDHTRRKIAFTWERMSARARALVPSLYLPAQARGLLPGAEKGRS